MPHQHIPSERRPKAWILNRSTTMTTQENQSDDDAHPETTATTTPKGFEDGATAETMAQRSALASYGYIVRLRL